MSTYMIEIDGQKIHIQEDGPANGPVAILIHGWSSSSFTWAPVLPLLSRRYRCIAVDLPGFGESPAPRTAATIAGYADLIDRVIDYFSDEPVLVLGHSMGGQIAATLALRHPMQVAQMVMLGPALSGRLSTRVNLLMKPHVMAERFRFMEWLLYVAAKTPLDYTDKLLKPTNFAERARAHLSPEAYERIRADARRRGQGRMRAECFMAMQAGDLRGRLARIETPTLVIWGAEDNVVPLRDAGAVADEWPCADLRIIPNASHWPQFEQTEATLRHIALFLGLPPRSDTRQESKQDLARLQDIAQFLNNSEIGRDGTLNEAQRMRLAALIHAYAYRANVSIASANTSGDEMYIVMDGTLEVWQAGSATRPPVQLATIRAGQVAGELALLEGAVRSADMRAGPEGVALLTITKEALATLAEQDPTMGMQMMKNLAVSLGRRLRHQNWRASRIAAEASVHA